MNETLATETSVSRETRARLEQFVALVRKWSPAINLVSGKDLPILWDRHVVDSLQLWQAVPIAGGRWVDLGSGGGFPGAVVAIMAQDRAPGLSVTLVESDQRKAAFLRTVSRETGCAFSVIAERAETIPPLQADVLSARALAPLERLLDHAERHLAPSGVAIFPKGARHQHERTEAQRRWFFSWDVLPSLTDDRAVVYRIRKVERV